MKHEFPEKFDMRANAVSKLSAEQAVLIVGHPMTDYRRVETVLQGVGMLPAQKTRQQGLEPTEISAHLLKRAGVVPDFSVKIEQVAPSPIWQILALDLFMGNSDAGFWGWSDPRCVYLLDYWHATDPAMHFIFVYDSLEHVLVRASAGRELSREAINKLISEWQSFYTALMHFYHRHRERCLLVHAEQACANPEAFDKALSSCLQRPLERDASTSVVSMALDLLEASLAASMVKEQHAWQCSYEELQSQADFPLSKGKATDSLAAWNGFSALTMQIRLHGEALSVAEEQVTQTQAQLEVVQGQKGEAESRLNKQQKEAELLLLQLHQVQEELEHHFLENGALKQEGNALKQSLAEAKAIAEAQLTALQRQLEATKELAQKTQSDRDIKLKALAAAEVQVAQTRTQLEVAQAQKAEVEVQLNEQQKEAELLLLQLHQVQEELEHYFLENGALKQEGNALKQSLAEAKATTETQVGALQRQLDETQASAKKAQSDLDAKIKVLAEAKDKLEQKVAALEQQVPQTTPQELQQENELLLLQLHQVQEELERYYLETQQLKQRVAMPQPKQSGPKHPGPHYGAAERVKRQLSYRLGAVMLTQAKSFTGWLGMPSALLREARQFKQDKSSSNTGKLPQLSQYADADEGERVKRHLSYRLGATLLTNYHSPIGWIKLPWLMRNQVREFKRERASR